MFYVLHNCCYNYHYLLVGGILSSKILLIEVICVLDPPVHCRFFAGHSTSRSKLSPGQSTSKLVVPRTLYFEVNCPPDTSLRSRANCPLTRGTIYFEGGHFPSKWSVRGRQFASKCPGDSLLRSNSPPGHYTSGGKLLRDRPTLSRPGANPQTERKIIKKNWNALYQPSQRLPLRVGRADRTILVPCA